MLYKCKLIIIAVFLGCFSKNIAQVDTSFWFVAPDISQGLGDRPIKIYFSSYNSPAVITISQPANSSFIPVTINLPVYSSDSLDLTPFIDSVENNIADKILRRGIHISSTTPISVYYSINSSSNREFISLKGRAALDTNFYTPFQNTYLSSNTISPHGKSCIDIVATENNTTVLITPRSKIIGHNANVTFSILLQKGQTYSCQDTTTIAPTGLSGSIISSNKPISITVSSSGLVNNGCLSTVADQITSTNYLSTKYAVIKSNSNSNSDIVYILSIANSTSITINNGGPLFGTLINFGQTYSVALTAPITYIQSTQPVYVFHVGGYGCKMSGSQVPPLFCTGTYTTSFVRTSSDSLAVHLVTHAGKEGLFTVNGISGIINASDFSVVPGTGGTMVATRKYLSTSQLPLGSQCIISNSGDVFACAINQGAQINNSSYAYLSNFRSSPFANAGSDGVICSNTSYILNGIIGGGDITGVWSTNGFGSFLSGTSALSNTYIPSPLDTAIKPVKIILSSTGNCPNVKDTLNLNVIPAPIVNAGIDQVKCTNNAATVLSGTITGFTTSGIWNSSGTGTISPSANSMNITYYPSSSDTSQPFIYLILTSTNNSICAAVSDSVKISFIKQVSIDAGPASASVCANNATLSLTGVISGTNTNTVKWSTSGNGLFSPSSTQLTTTYVASSSDVANGTVYLKITSTNNGLCKAVSDSIQVVFTTPPSVNAGLDIYSCKNSPQTILSGTISGPTSTGIWGNGSGTFVPSNTVLNTTYIPTPSEISAGYVILSLTSTNNGNCIAVSDQVRIDFKEKPYANFTTNNVCKEQQTPFTDFSLPINGSLSSWQWDFGDGGNSNIQNPSHLYAHANTYTVSLIVQNSFGCFDTIQKSVEVYPKPIANFTYSRTCISNNLQFFFNDSSYIDLSDTITSFYYDFGGAGTSIQQNPIIYFPSSGYYSITHIVTSNHNCKDTIVKSINVTPGPSAGFYYVTNSGLTIGSNVSFVDTSKNSVSWYWAFGDGNSSTNQNPYNTYYANGTYTVIQIVTDQYGCKDTAIAQIKILNVANEIEQLIPNAISPNNDGKNDVWRLDFINVYYPDAEIEIFNRWGERIYYSKGYSNVWDGTYNGNPLPVGTYYYVINLNHNDPSKQKIFKGSILLIK